MKKGFVSEIPESLVQFLTISGFLVKEDNELIGQDLDFIVIGGEKFFLHCFSLPKTDRSDCPTINCLGKDGRATIISSDGETFRMAFCDVCNNFNFVKIEIDEDDLKSFFKKHIVELIKEKTVFKPIKATSH